MNKLGNALYEIHHMDMLAAKDQWVNKIHPLVKLVLTIVFLTVTMSFPKYDLTGLLRMGIYPIVLFIVGEISLSDSIRRLRIVLPLVCFVGLFNPIFDRQVIGYIGTVPLTAPLFVRFFKTCCAINRGEAVRQASPILRICAFAHTDYAVFLAAD